MIIFSFFNSLDTFIHEFSNIKYHQILNKKNAPLFYKTCPACERGEPPKVATLST